MKLLRADTENGHFYELIESPQALTEMRKVFGDMLQAVLIPEYEEPWNNLGGDFDGKTLCLCFSNGTSVMASSSEWGSFQRIARVREVA